MEFSLENSKFTARDLNKYVQDNSDKYTHLGSGSFGSVYRYCDSQVVVKISTIEDLGYLLYSKYLCENQPDNPHFPKVFKQVIIDEYVITYLEKLSPLPSYNSNKYEKYGRLVYDCLEYGHSLGEINLITDPLIINALDTICLLKLEDDNIRTDFGDSNCMLRNETLVFTDPLYAQGIRHKKYFCLNASSQDEIYMYSPI